MSIVGIPSGVTSLVGRHVELSKYAIFCTISLLFLAVLTIAQPARAAAPHCPPGACVDLEEATALKQELKKEMARAGVPPRLQALVDKLPNCADCIKAARLSIVTVHDRAVGDALLERAGSLGAGYDFNQTDRSTYIQSPWSPNNERIARAQMQDGRAKTIHFTLHQGPCICCPDNENEAAQWKDNGGAVRKADTLINNEIVISIFSADQLGALPRDLYELDPTLTNAAIDGPPVVSNRLPVTFPKLLRFVSVVCPECRGLAAERNALVEEYNNKREKAAAEYIEGSRLLALHVARSAETQRIRALIANPTATNPNATVDQRNADRERVDGRLLRQANALFASSRALVNEMKALKPDIDRLDAALLQCDQQPCNEDKTAINDAIEPAHDTNEADETDAETQLSQTFAVFAGMAFKNSIMSSNLHYLSGSQDSSGDAAVNSAAFSFGLMAYPFAGLPIYVSAEGMVFAGGDGAFYSVSLHPTAGDDTTAEGRPVWAGRVSLGVTIPFEGGCVSRSSCFLVDVDGGLVLERTRTTFTTDETGGGSPGQRNSFTFDQTNVGVSVGAALSMPLCAFMDVACGVALAPFARVTWFPDAEENFSRTTSAFNLDYAGDFDIDTQYELGMRLIVPFGPSR
ncbi:MAG: hypothetical protein AB8B94_12195 [Hyphomicrobiales bacterium]